MTDQQILTLVIGGIVTLLGGLIAARVGKSGSRENALIDQIQEQLEAERAERKEEQRRHTERLAYLDGRVNELFERVQHLMTRETWWSIHTAKLEAQVDALGGVPVPRPMQLGQPTTPPTLD